MEEETFEAIDKYDSMINELYFELESLGVNLEEVNDLFDKFDALKNQLLKLEEYTDKKKVVNKKGHINQNHKGLEKYTTLNIVYQYENGYSLCKTTTNLIYHVPNELIDLD